MEFVVFFKLTRSKKTLLLIGGGKLHNKATILHPLYNTEQIYMPKAASIIIIIWSTKKAAALATRITMQKPKLMILFLGVSISSHERGSCAQNVSGSELNREKSRISRLAICQSTNRACIDLNNTRMVGKSHHLLSSL